MRRLALVPALLAATLPAVAAPPAHATVVYDTIFSLRFVIACDPALPGTCDVSFTQAACLERAGQPPCTIDPLTVRVTAPAAAACHPGLALSVTDAARLVFHTAVGELSYRVQVVVAGGTVTLAGPREQIAFVEQGAVAATGFDGNPVRDIATTGCPDGLEGVAQGVATYVAA